MPVQIPEDLNSLSLLRQILKEEHSFKSTRHCKFFNGEGNEISEGTLVLVKDGDTVYIEIAPEKPFNYLNILKQYKITQKLGQGGFGKVYKAHHRLTQEPVAIKFIDITNYRTPP